MIRFTKGNLLTANAEALVNAVNTVGVMGKGIALQFKEEFPENFAIYADACKSGELVPGKLLITNEKNRDGEEKTIINFPTKLNWRNPSKYEYIRDGLAELVKAIGERKITSFAIPPLGCGNGGLKWEIVKGLIEEALNDVDADISIYEPNTEIKSMLQSKPVGKESDVLSENRKPLYFGGCFRGNAGTHRTVGTIPPLCRICCQLEQQHTEPPQRE